MSTYNLRNYFDHIMREITRLPNPEKDGQKT